MAIHLRLSSIGQWQADDTIADLTIRYGGSGGNQQHHLSGA
jgi:hypothetical protein